MPTLQKKIVKGDPFCEFCSTMMFTRKLIFDRCERYNKKSHVKSAHAFTGVRIVNYIVDNRKWVVEEQSKCYAQLRFCPICGFDFVRQEKYDGKKYKTAFGVNKLPANWKDANERGQQESD